MFNEGRFSLISQLLANPVVLLVGLVAVVLIAFALLHQKARWVVLCGLMLLATFSPATDYWERWVVPPLGFSTIVLHARSMVIVLLGMTAAVAVVWVSRVGVFRVPPVLGVLFGLQLMLCARYIMTPFQAEAAARAVAYLLLLGMGAGISSLVSSSEGYRRCVATFVFAAAAFAACNVLVYVWDGGRMSASGRYFGLTANPNHLAMASAIFYPIVLASVFRWDFRLSPRILLGLLAVCLVLLVYVSGSRNGMLMIAIASAVFFGMDAKRVVWGVPLALLVLVGVYLRWDEMPEVAGRLLSTENTRLGVYSYYWNVFLDNIIVGTSELGFKYPESSYLAIASQLGLVGLIVVLVFVGLAVQMMFRLYVIAKAPGFDPLAKLHVHGLIAGMLAIGIASGLEAILLAGLNSFAFAISWYAVLADRMLLETSKVHGVDLEQGVGMHGRALA